MILDNLKAPDKERIKSGDLAFIKELIRKDLETTKESLITFPIDKVQELRGRAKVLSTLLTLLV